jgi:pilus assembly protein CpaF
VRALQAQIADEMTAHKQRREARGERELSAADERQMALSLMQATVSRHMEVRLANGLELPDASYDLRLVEAIDNAMYKAGEIQDLLDDQLIENIDINGCDEVWVTYADHRGKVRARPVTGTDEDLIALVQTLGSYAGVNARPFTPAHPELDVRLPDGSRLSAVMSASERPTVSIRRNRFPQMFVQTLVRLGTVDEQLAAFLKAAVLSRANIMIGGATDAGKTTLARSLINCIPPRERLVVVERALELGLRRHPELHEDVVEYEEVLPDADGNGGLTLRQLVLRTRRMNPSRVILGEVLGPEAVELMSAMSQGNNGSLSTVHARSAKDVFARLATYAAQYEGMPFEVTHSLIAGAIDYVVFIEKNRALGGLRCVTQVVEVSGFADGRVSAAEIFRPSPVDGRAVRAATVPITRRLDLLEVGYDDLGSAWSMQQDSSWSPLDLT